MGLAPFLSIKREQLVIARGQSNLHSLRLRDHTLSESKALDFLDSVMSLLALDSINHWFLGFIILL
ncbi:hypothetical protein [uncultured Helicobacter sp.]|uniref:hypothetical protein n=1 Tax=uncultured Helicobacter sp. TaxID=175537 RepID=UPI00374EA613